MRNRSKVVYRNEHGQVIIKNEFGEPTLIRHDFVSLSNRAVFAASLIERWGMVTAEPAGEDSRGRAMSIPMAPRDIVARACGVTQEFFDEIETRGWLLEVPTWEEAKTICEKIEANRE